MGKASDKQASRRRLGAYATAAVGLVLIVIPDPATTIAGLGLVLVAAGANPDKVSAR